MPEGDAQREFGKATEIEFAFVNGDFESAFVGGLRNLGRIEQADASFFDGKFLQTTTFEIDDEGDFFGSANGNAEFGIFKFGQNICETIDTHDEALFLETVAQFAEMEGAAMHGAAATFGRINAGAEPFEIAGVDAIDFDVEHGGGSQLVGALGHALDGLG